MKILLPTIYHPFIGGITIHIDNLIKNLNDIDDYEFYILNYKSNINIPQNINNLNVNVIEVPYIKKIRGLSYLKNGYKIGKKIIEKYDIDLIHSHYAFPQGVLGAKLSKKYNIPNILTLHGSDVLKLSKNPVGKSFFNYAVNNTDKLICVSNFLKQELPATCQNKSTVIYNGVDFNLFNTKNNRDDNYAIFVGSFVPQKGLNLLVDVIKDIDYNFKFIGDGPLYNSIKNKIKNENLPNNFQGKLSDRSEASIPKSKICEFPVGNILSNIELLGRQNPQMVAQYIKNSSFLILPSISEGLGMTIIEAMACGKPVIGTKVGGIPELIKNNYNGFLIEPNNPDELKLRIKFLIDNTNGKKLRKELGTNGEIFSKSFDWKKTAKEVHKLYNSFK